MVSSYVEQIISRFSNLSSQPDPQKAVQDVCTMCQGLGMIVDIIMLLLIIRMLLDVVIMLNCFKRHYWNPKRRKEDHANGV